jgi:hypothetical protein
VHDEDTPESMEGTAAHWVATDWLVGIQHKEGEIAPNGVAVTAEMIEGAQLYDSAVWGFVKKYGGVPETEKETRAHRIHENCYGTLDTVVVGYEDQNPKRRIIGLFDYKFGFGYVDVFENWQLIEYMAGEIEPLPSTLDAHTWVEMTIVQPRSYRSEGQVRTWRIKLGDLRAYFNIAHGFEHEAMKPDAPTRTGPQCADCKARFKCKAIQASAYQAAEMSRDGVPFDLPNDAAARELQVLQDASKRLEARITGLEAELFSRLRAGQRVAGYELTNVQSRERWSVAIQDVIDLAESFGVSVAKPGVVTPNQARTAGLDPSIVAAISHRPQGELKLTRVDIKKLQRIFS